MPHSHFIIHLRIFKSVYLRIKRKRNCWELYNFPIGTMAIGRLDEDSEGLLLTTDGMMSEIIRSIDKEYLCK
jgi:23S rRNA pseudouridine2457 synthase